MNRMLPVAMRSSRATNFFKQLCVESTGTASFTMFAPIGQVTNVTAFHQETKKRRSWNCGSGDFIVQPVASASNIRLAWVVLVACASAVRLDQVSSMAWRVLLSCASRVRSGQPRSARLCHDGSVGDELHMVFECACLQPL